MRACQQNITKLWLTGLIIFAGNSYRGNKDEFVRINLACSKELVIDGMQRLKQGIEALGK